MTHSVIITDAAKADIRDITAYGKVHYGVIRGTAYVQGVYERLATLADFPNLGHVRNDIPNRYKALRVGDAHFAICRVEGKIVIVLRILYHTADFSQHDLH